MTGTGNHIELPDPGPEPERYYDWMLWKLRQTPGWMKTVHGNYNNNYIYESPDGGKTIYRRKMGEKERELVSQKKTIIADMVNHPPHYNKGIETSEYINSWEMSYPQGNVIKYVTRYNLKHSDLRKQREDLAKAKWYLNDLIVQLEKKISD